VLYNCAMPTSILATKLYIPPTRSGLVVRPRLIERLSRKQQRKLTLVSAPAGFGKTTVISEWIAAGNQPAAWLSLDEGDSDPNRFLIYLVAALQMLAEDIGVEIIGDGLLAALQSPQPPSTDSLLITLINEIAAMSDDWLLDDRLSDEPLSSNGLSGAGPGFVLILDDYHLIDSQPIDDALTFLIDHLPPQMRLVIVTREDPNLPLARYRARGQLIELRAADLRFTPSEATTFLNMMMDLDLSTEEVAALEARTEGWIAGLQLAALSLQGRGETTAFVQAFTGSNRFVLDYLVEEVLQRQPEHVRNFLLQTSILDRLSGPLCNAVIAQEGSQTMLEVLERDNLFVVHLDDKRHWYRYHHLFADALQARALAEQPEQVAILHQRASDWYAANNLPAYAVRHAMAAGDSGRVAALAEQTWRSMDRSYRSATWRGWVDTLPKELVRERPVLCAQLAWALLDGGEMEAAACRLHDAERWLALCEGSRSPVTGMVVVDEEELRSLPITVANARAYLALSIGDVSSAVVDARRALDLPVETDDFEHGLSVLLLGFAYWASGDLESAKETVSDAMANMWLAGNVPFAISFTSYLADIIMAQGRPNDAIQIYEQALQLVAAQGEPEVAETAVLHLGLSELYLEQGDMDAATRHLLNGDALGEQPAFPPWRRHWSRAHVRMKRVQEDLDGAIEVLGKAERLYYRHPVPDVRPASALKARVRLLQGRLADALTWARERNLSTDDDLCYLREFEHITLARILVAIYRNDGDDHAIRGARALLKRLEHAAAIGSRTGSLIEILVVHALVHEACGDIPAALDLLARALALAEPQGYLRIFTDEGAPMADLLSAAAAAGIMPVYVHRLRALLGTDEDPGPEQDAKAYSPLPLLPSTLPVPSGAIIEALTPRELEILHGIAAGSKNQEIADELFISLNTVRYHTKNLYGKLGVNKRTQAVAKAQELGML